MGFGGSYTPPPPPPPKPAPAPAVAPTVDMARKKVMDEEAQTQLRGRASTILTGSDGALAPAKTGVKQLLGA